MKNKRLKFYLVAFYLYSNVALFAQSGLGSTNELGNLEDDDVVKTKEVAPLPIDDYVWVLALIGLIYVFMKFRTYQKNSIQS